MGFSLRKLIPNFIVNTLWHLPKAVAANLWYGFPSKNLTIIGITGTSGKTSVAHLTYHLLLKAGYKIALISTIEAKIGKKIVDIGLHVTNPDPFTLQKLLKIIQDKDYTHVVLEVTSHGLNQFRPWGIDFEYGVLTNLAHEHLDYHKTLKKYHQAKLKLIKNSKIAVLNQGDKHYKLAKKAATSKIITYQKNSHFQQTNINTASAIVKDLGLTAKQINQYLKTAPSIPGRMEIIQTKPFTVVIDFAHKPDALEAALKSLRQLKPKRIISVFGCAGLRDIQKRPLMGKISAQLSDITVLTAEDPRSESVRSINSQIEAGFKKVKNKKLFRIPDRQQAINKAIELAKPGDLVALFGKGHEKSNCFGTIEHPWSEHQAIKKALKLIIKKT